MKRNITLIVFTIYLVIMTLLNLSDYNLNAANNLIIISSLILNIFLLNFIYKWYNDKIKKKTKISFDGYILVLIILISLSVAIIILPIYAMIYMFF